MRFKSRIQNGYCIYAISGVNTVSFAIDSHQADTSGLLGFAVERIDPRENERYFLYGFKVFKELVTSPYENMVVSTFDNPVQSFVWDDFTVKPEYRYTYLFYPLKGKPKNLIREDPVIIDIRAEALFSRQEHDVFFNRGVASSQAYARRFNNKKPRELPEEKRIEAEAWLSRSLDDAILKFIQQARPGDTLLGCFYEFRYLPILSAFKKALDQGVTVQIIIDAKQNERQDKTGRTIASFPREDNLRMIQQAGISMDHILLREANTNYIQHNKFMVYLRAGEDKAEPVAVWTGSTNLSEGGILGQTNVGHWIRNRKVARKYRTYWEILATDPGAISAGSRGDNRKRNAELKKKISALQDDIRPAEIADLPVGITPVFSPRRGYTMLNTYAAMLDKARKTATITLAFGISNTFKELLVDNTSRDQIIFMLLEKKDKPNPRDKRNTFIRLGARNNVYQAYGAFFKDNLYKWTREINSRILKINHHVSYIHSKFLLMDPLSDMPVIVTGSANFSKSSTCNNDENMVIIKGNLRATDIYYTEFNRLFNHYYFRSVYEELKNRGVLDRNQGIYIKPDDSWLHKYAPGTYRNKRIRMYREMKGFSQG